MRPLITIIIIFLSIPSMGQGPRNALDKTFVEKTIAYYYSIQANKHPGNLTFFIEKDSINQRAKTDYGSFKIQFVSPAEAQAKSGESNNEGSRLDRLVVKWVTLDTIDVVITGCTIGVRKVKSTVNKKTITTTENFMTNCTEQWVDIPTCRFVYDPTTSTWTQLNRGKDLKK